MILGGTIVGSWVNVSEWESLLMKSRFKAITAPFSCRTPEKEVGEYLEAAARHGVVIAEIGVWKNLMDPDPRAAEEAFEYAKGQLALADRVGIPCCVNIVGTTGSAGWDAADPSNYAPETYERILKMTRRIIDEVNPRKAFYCIEPMPWMVPDGPEEYLQLIRDVNREQFGAHMDFINMINSPRRYLAAERFIDDCFRILGPYIKSTHITDTRMNPTALTTLLEECSPGEGSLDYEQVLKIMNRYLPEDAPVLLEHMQTEEEYRQAYTYVAEKAAAAGIPI